MLFYAHKHTHTHTNNLKTWQIIKDCWNDAYSINIIDIDVSFKAVWVSFYLLWPKKRICIIIVTFLQILSYINIFINIYEDFYHTTNISNFLTTRVIIFSTRLQSRLPQSYSRSRSFYKIFGITEAASVRGGLY